MYIYTLLYIYIYIYIYISLRIYIYISLLTKLSNCKPIVSKGKSKFPSVQGGFRYDDEEGNKGFVYIYIYIYILEGQGSSWKALKCLRVLKGLMRRENKVLRAGTQLGARAQVQG